MAIVNKRVLLLQTYSIGLGQLSVRHKYWRFDNVEVGEDNLRPFNIVME
jgi:hypothetical protein